MEGHAHILEFWYMADNFTKDLFSRPGHQSNEADLELAMHIYDRCTHRGHQYRVGVCVCVCMRC